MRGITKKSAVMAVCAIALILMSCRDARLPAQVQEGCQAPQTGAIRPASERLDSPEQRFAQNIAFLLANGNKDMLKLSTAERQQIAVAADGVRWPKYGPFFAGQVRNSDGMTNIVYVEANYPWTTTSYLVLRMSLMGPAGGSSSYEFQIGRRISPIRCEIIADSGDGRGGDLLVLHATWWDLKHRYFFAFKPDNHGLSVPEPIRVEHMVRFADNPKEERWFTNRCELISEEEDDRFTVKSVAPIEGQQDPPSDKPKPDE